MRDEREEEEERVKAVCKGAGSSAGIGDTTRRGEGGESAKATRALTANTRLWRFDEYFYQTSNIHHNPSHSTSGAMHT